MKLRFGSIPLLLTGVFFFYGDVPPNFDKESAQEGDWQTASTWKEATAPSCNTSEKILIDGDTVTAGCAVAFSGQGRLLVRNEGHLLVQKDLSASGNASIEVGGSSSMKVEGNIEVSGQGSFKTDGSTEATGDLDLSGNNAVANGSGSLTLGGTGCDQFTGSGTCNSSVPLPVEMKSFQAVSSSEEGIRLKWTTATEDRNDRFIVQRSSNGSKYERLQKIEGQGTSVEPHRYSYLDEDPPSGDRYYRLIQVDYDGNREVYGPRTATYRDPKGKADCEMKVVPNPCRGNCKLRFEGSCEEKLEEDELQVQLFDVAGNRIHADLEPGGSFGSDLMLDTKNHLSPGVYVVRAVSKEGTVASEKMKKQ